MQNSYFCVQYIQEIKRKCKYKVIICKSKFGVSFGKLKTTDAKNLICFWVMEENGKVYQYQNTQFSYSNKTFPFTGVPCTTLWYLQSMLPGDFQQKPVIFICQEAHFLYRLYGQAWCNYAFFVLTKSVIVSLLQNNPRCMKTILKNYLIFSVVATVTPISAMSTLNWASFWWGAIFALPSTLIFIYAYLLGNLSLRYPLFPRKSICIHHSHSPIRFQIYNSSS